MNELTKILSTELEAESVNAFRRVAENHDLTAPQLLRCLIRKVACGDITLTTRVEVVNGIVKIKPEALKDNKLTP